MSVKVAHFAHRWEAEFAQGFLDEAGVPSRLLDEGLAGSGPYVGDLGGASLEVRDPDEVRAREVLEAAGVLERPDGAHPIPLMERDLPPVARADLEDLTEQIRLARRRETRHGIYALIGLSPAALIPAVAALVEGSVRMLVLLVLVVVFVEGARWILAGREAARLEARLEEMREELEGGDGGQALDGPSR